MKDKSKFLPPLTTRDGLNYPPSGTWMRDARFNKLSALAKNLDISLLKKHPDKLHSVPTPWARLLLFETALFDRDHPAHAEVRDQWRGLLGIIGLANVLGLNDNLTVETFNLATEPESDIRNAFTELRPRQVIGKVDKESNNWNTFGLIFIDGHLLGGTSPRTIVFTGISHSVPSQIPFYSPEGRLRDPAKYYKNSDPQFLACLREWINRLIDSIRADLRFISWLGNPPTDPNAQQELRANQLLGALAEWRDEIEPENSSVTIMLSGYSRLPTPFDVVRHVESANIIVESDFFFANRTNLMVLYKPGASKPGVHSNCVGERDNDLKGQLLTIYGGHKITIGQPLPSKLNFISPEIVVIEDVAELFEDTLIEVNIIDSKSTVCLSLDNKNYLLPFRKTITELFDQDELRLIVQNTQLKRLDASKLRVETRFPLVNARSIVVSIDYTHGQTIITNENTDHPTQELAVWPDFVCNERDSDGEKIFNHYFYYTSDIQEGTQSQIEFSPVGGEFVRRTNPATRKSWYVSEDPICSFVGSVGSKQGLLLVNLVTIPKPISHWKIGLDFGSTHTSIFRCKVELQADDSWKATGDVEPVYIEPRVRILTQGDAAAIQENFFLYRTATSLATGGTQAGTREANLTTQLSMPLGYAEYFADDWLPREGQVFLGSILDGPPPKIETDLKWNSDRNNHTTSAFLRSLVLMIEAEAVANGAQIAHIAHAFPTAFSAELSLKHANEWEAVERCVGVPVDREPLPEAVAVCRHLWGNARGVPYANLIALDVGGSTTDIAVWADGALQIQESVKMAAGGASRYVESDAARGYREWLVETLKADEPFRSKRLLADNFSPDILKNRRNYLAVLKRLSEQGLIDSFVKAINVAAKTNSNTQAFLSPIVVILASVSYFAGLLTRKVLRNQSPAYYTYYCGKGGQLLRWIPDGDKAMKEIFTAGVVGPHFNGNRPNAVINISTFPKEEVGRGLLIENPVTVNNGDTTEGIFSEAEPTTTVGEEGYLGLTWDGLLKFRDLSKIVDHVPTVDKMSELNNFVDTLRSSQLTSGVASRMGIGGIIADPLFRDTLRQRIYDNVAAGYGNALIEPLFITEAKVMIEMMTNTRGLFD